MHTLRDYSLPLLLALLFHAGAALALVRGWNPEDTEARVIRPEIVSARLIVLERAKPRATRTAPPVTTTPAAPPPDRQAAPKPPPPQVDPAERERQKREAERAREEAARQERLARLAETAFKDALAKERIDLAEDTHSDAASTYIDGIYQAVVRNWSRPPSARNDMQAELLVELIPTGEVVSVTLVASSGSTAFDRSAEAAVRKARRFQVPTDIGLFEARFRQFTLLFKPEDLLR